MDKDRIYSDVMQELSAVLQGEEDFIARMSTVCSVLKQALPWASWVGFYRVVKPRLLVAGPYQGGLGCLRISFDRGVCGAAARTGRTQIVPDVHSFPDHIACDEAARSEIVIPVRNRSGELIAVLDLDSRQPAAFDEADQAYLERISEIVTG